MINKRILITALFSLFLSNAALATIIPPNLAIDFRDAGWSGANGSASWSVGITTATAAGSGTALYQDSIDGLGVLTPGPESDEVELEEILHVAFSGGAVLNGVWITDLFKAPDGGAPGTGEVGQYRIDGGSWVTFTANDLGQDDVNGELLVSFGGSTSMGTIEFRADPSVTVNNEFSVAGFVPEPGPLALLGISLVALSVSSLRRKKQV